ncbi:SMP-30/gluconolactonase/LRE family protein [Acidisoma cellulosilytica]|uniref:SMP-30/gluconolactonase/LRE family protein n=1 Tax=Acidisoma cellulosilyticum TaxID=2802395 RepID=A0A964E719_9PROT|nr:SMP-30/gluconolactonase/LRE family protein [Acidisoma cellulosilyticum]MCB8884057.1 SMP-30/gluconolactonase/LRE family protein [Acidisoma cellulosilyticum]
MDIELVLDAQATIGESPTWVQDDNVLFWIDVKAPALHRFDPANAATKTWTLPSDIGGFALSSDRSKALVALRTGIFVLSLGDDSLQRIADAPFDGRLHRFNEGACDSLGRFWVGTMFDPLPPSSQTPIPGGLYNFTSSDGLHTVSDEGELHNGMAWSTDGTTFYLAHSNRGVVYQFPYKIDDGSFGRRNRFVEIPKELGLPDGAAVDIEGGYWCAVHGGSRLRRYRSNGLLDQEFMLPISQPTMCAFGGRDLDQLYITSSTDSLSPARRQAEPFAGGLFRVKVPVPGCVRHCYFN